MIGLLLLSAGFMAGVMLITFGIEKWVGTTQLFSQAQPVSRKAQEASKPAFSAAIEGARLVAASRYLLAIVIIMASYELASQVMDFQFKLRTETLEGVTNTQAFMANVYFFANLLSVVVQFFLVSLIMRKFGITAALLVLPLAILGSSTAFILVPTLLVSSLLVISDNGLNYSIQQTARESLYVVTSRDEKYKARAFTNMLVQRVAKGVGIFGILGLRFVGTEARWLSLITITVVAAMILASIYAGRQFAARSAAEERRERAGLKASVPSRERV
jgi:ATP:ADP antiporter, AAA family